MIDGDEILQLRLANQHLANNRLSDPTQLVAQLGAVQAQDYSAAKWALGLRLCQATDQLLEESFAKADFLRTHVLRPTWHFVAPADIRWMLALTAPRIKAATASYSRVLGFDEAIFSHSARVIQRALEGGNSLTRAELRVALEQADIAVPDGGWLGRMILQAELDALVCSGPRRGVQHTYALLDERVPPAPLFQVDEALVELTWRYFSSHGPALVQDCSWWSGLPVGEVRRGVELNGWRLDHEVVGGQTYWFHQTSPRSMPQTTYLLPNFDEYTVAYRSRGLYFDRARNWTGNPRHDVPFGNVIVVDGRVVGRWQRTKQRDRLNIESQWSIQPSDAERRALDVATERYIAFHGVNQ
jgi:hypothetical protein